MKKKMLLILLSAILVAALSFGSISFAATSVTATVATGKVTINNQVIDTEHMEYPLLVYRDTTYLPQTYDFGQALGLRVIWQNDLQRLVIDRTEPVPYTSKSDKKQTGTVSARVVDYKVQAHSNGASYEISSAEEEHPLLNYADITYLPVTERFMIDIFDWYYTLNAENGLWIDTTKGPIHQTLDVVLEALSEKYAAGGTYRGTLTGKGDTVLFHATVQTEKHVNKDVKETFSGYTALVSIDLLKKSVEQIAILTDNYVLTMVA